jgi:hypothetical protein
MFHFKDKYPVIVLLSFSLHLSSLKEVSRPLLVTCRVEWKSKGAKGLNKRIGGRLGTG